MKVLEIVEIERWVDGSGFSNSEIYSNQVAEVVGGTIEEVKASFDWSWWDKSEQVPGEDLKITVKYFRPDFDPMFDEEEPLAKFETWESEIDD